MGVTSVRAQWRIAVKQLGLLPDHKFGPRASADHATGHRQPKAASNQYPVTYPVTSLTWAPRFGDIQGARKPRPRAQSVRFDCFSPQRHPRLPEPRTDRFRLRSTCAWRRCASTQTPRGKIVCRGLRIVPPARVPSPMPSLSLGVNRDSAVAGRCSTGRAGARAAPGAPFGGSPPTPNPNARESRSDGGRPVARPSPSPGSLHQWGGRGTPHLGF